MKPLDWHACSEAIEPVKGTLLRLVESQEQVATTHLVGIERQGILEELLERTKPPVPPAAKGMHYLLATPFRYPPLQHGSRFGTRFEPSIFYGAHGTRTVLAESAYYRHYFWRGMQTPPPTPIRSEHLMFSARYRAKTGLHLQNSPFSQHEGVLRHPRDYSQTQALGAQMREAGIAAFEYISARDPEKGACVGLFTPNALASRRPESTEGWLCETDAHRVQFRCRAVLEQFPLELFIHEGTFPMPA